MRRASVICTHLSRIRPARALTSHGGGSLASVAFGLALLAALAGCGPEGRDAESLERAVRRSLQLMNAEDWQAAYGEVLTASQRATCTAAEYARRESAGLAAIRDSLGPGELSVIVRRYQQSVTAMSYYFRYASGSGGNHRHVARHGLNNYATEGLIVGSQYHNVCGAIPRSYVINLPDPMDSV
jgi:hypothetical protein